LCAEDVDKSLIFIFVILDNLFYCGQQDDLSLCLLTAAGKFHLEGRLVIMVSKHHLHPLVKEMAGILSCRGDNLKYLFFSPFPKFLLYSCCGDPGH
jgi:hypothetical protein